MSISLLSTISQGILVTLQLTVFGFGIGAILGIPLVVIRTSRVAIFRLLARVYIELIRGVPIIVWLFLIYNGPIQFDTSLGQLFTPMRSAVLGLGLISAAFMAEIYRGCLRSIHKGQWEAANALGMSSTSRATHVIGPQMIRTAVPAAATYGIALIKDSSIASTIGVLDITYFANSAAALSVSILPYFVAGALYIALTLPAAWLARRVDAKLRRRVAR